MRAVNFVVVASGLSAIFLGLALAGAVLASTLQSQIYARSLSPAIVSN
jgi:hypothetical protein